MRLRYTPRASRQLRAISDYLVVRSPLAARRVQRRIRETARFLAEFPHVGHKGAFVGTRELAVPSLPYVIVHRIDPGDPQTLTVLGIYHTARLRPGQQAPNDD